MVARGRDGKLRSYPVVETAHQDNICHTVEAPAAIPEATAKAALKVAEKAVGCLYGAGVFGVELFLLPDGQVSRTAPASPLLKQANSGANLFPFGKDWARFWRRTKSIRNSVSEALVPFC